MTDTAPPPTAPVAPPLYKDSVLQSAEPQSWQNPRAAVGSVPPQPGPPAFDPRRAVGTPATHSARQGTHPIMAPPPMLQDGLAQSAPSPYANTGDYGAPQPHSPPHYVAQSPASNPRAAAFPGMAAQDQGYAPAPIAPPHYAPSPQAMGHPAAAYAAPGTYDYPQATRAEPDQPRASLLSRLTSRVKPTQTDGAASAHPQAYPSAQSADPNQAPNQANARKPFLLGLLTGVVVMLILGQVFRASAPSPDYAQTLPPINMTIEDGPAIDPATDDPTAVAFLDTVEGLN